MLLLLYTAFTTVSATYGFGQNIWDIQSDDDEAKAIFWEVLGQTAAVFGMAVAKWSLGLFLLRIVQEPWHHVSIWVAMVSLMASSISVAFVLWLKVSTPD